MTTTRTQLEALRAELEHASKPRAPTPPTTYTGVQQITEEIRQLGAKAARDRNARDRAQLQRHLTSLGTVSDVAGVPATTDLGTALKAAGFRRGGPPVERAERGRARSRRRRRRSTAAADIDTGGAPRRFFAPPLGLENARYLVPAAPQRDGRVRRDRRGELPPEVRPHHGQPRA